MDILSTCLKAQLCCLQRWIWSWDFSKQPAVALCIWGHSWHRRHSRIVGIVETVVTVGLQLRCAFGDRLHKKTVSVRLSSWNCGLTDKHSLETFSRTNATQKKSIDHLPFFLAINCRKKPSESMSSKISVDLWYKKLCFALIVLRCSLHTCAGDRVQITLKISVEHSLHHFIAWIYHNYIPLASNLSG